MSDNATIEMMPEELLQNYSSDPISFVPNYMSTYDAVYGHNFPIFSLGHVPTMLKDSRIKYGLGLLKGPIKTYTFFLPEEYEKDSAVHEVLREQGTQFAYIVKSKDKEIAEFVINTFKAIWDDGIDEFLTMLEWGFSCNQVHYELEDESDKRSISYKSMTWYNPIYVRALLLDKKLVGAEIRDVDGDRNFKLFGPKLLWGVHNKSHNRIFGLSRLSDCFTPWHELWCPYGARDIRRTWFQKNSFDSGEIRYPIGKTQLPNGQTIDNRDLATRICNNIRSGGFRIFPNDKDSSGKEYKWSYTGPEARVTPQGLMEYPKDLRNEMLEGMGIPPEVVESSGDSGFGSATGRKIPMSVYMSTLSNLAGYSVKTIKTSIIDWLVYVKFGKTRAYTVDRLVPIKGQEQQGDGPQTGFIDRTVQGTSLSD